MSYAGENWNYTGPSYKAMAILAIAFALTVWLLLALADIASAQATASEKAACRLDVIKFCRNSEGAFGILRCLQENRAKLRPTCAAVLTNRNL